MKVNKSYLCDRCGQNFKHRQSKSRHQLQCGNNKVPANLKCSSCSYQTKRKDSLLRHTRVCKGTQTQLKCKICSMVFKYKSDLSRHEVTHIKKKELMCDKCQKKFVRQNHFKKHMAICDVQSVKQTTLSFEDAFIIPEDDSCFESFLSPTSPDQVFPSMVFNSSIHNQEVPVPDNEVHLLFQSISEVTDSVMAEPGDEIHQAVQDIPDQVVPVETPTNEKISIRNQPVPVKSRPINSHSNFQLYFLNSLWMMISK